MLAVVVGGSFCILLNNGINFKSLISLVLSHIIYSIQIRENNYYQGVCMRRKVSKLGTFKITNRHNYINMLYTIDKQPSKVMNLFNFCKQNFLIGILDLF